MTHTLIIPDWTPVRTNQWIGKWWRTRYKLGREQNEIIAVARICHDTPKAVGCRRVSLEVHGWPGKRTIPDLDAFDKLFLDALVKCGLLLDDGAKGLVGRMEVKIVRSKTRKTIITLEDV